MVRRPPQKAFILAAGFGTRLLPLTRVTPKPLLPLGGVPMLDRALALVRGWGVREVCVNIHHGAARVFDHLVRRAPDGLRVEISLEPEILGTGGALTRASWFLAGGEPFWMVNADVAAALEPAPLLRAFVPGTTIASAWLSGTRGPRTVECRDGLVTQFQSAQPGAPGTFTFCGVHLVDPRILRYLPPEGFASIIGAYQKAMADGWRVAGVPFEGGFWADIGTPEQYIEAEVAWCARGGTPSSRSALPGKDLVRVCAKRRLILGPGVPARGYAGILAMRAEDALPPEAYALAQAWAPRTRGGLIACPLPPRGSSRTFTRLYAGRRTAILIAHQPEREENNLYAGHTRFLSSLGIPVPRVLAVDAGRHLAIYEDAGGASVQDAAPEWTPPRLERLYKRVLDALLVFHERGGSAARRRKINLMPPFDEKLYRWEHDLFCGLFLGERMRVEEKTIRAVRRELATAARALMTARPVLVHRDLQSSNILLRRSGWALIDFQGMRFGPAAYDLASLLLDPYLDIPGGMRDRLLAYYAGKADPASRVEDLFWPAAVQRLGQALGAYARLSKLPGMAHFAGYIPPALDRMAGALTRMKNMPVLSECVAGMRPR